MVVADLDVESIRRSPAKADAPAVVDPNAVLSALDSVIAAAGTPIGQISVPLEERRTNVDLTVTAQDGVTTRSYVITIIRSRR
mgnify:CR=1 FL=1